MCLSLDFYSNLKNHNSQVFYNFIITKVGENENYIQRLTNLRHIPLFFSFFFMLKHPNFFESKTFFEILLSFIKYIFIFVYIIELSFCKTIGWPERDFITLDTGESEKSW